MRLAYCLIVVGLLLVCLHAKKITIIHTTDIHGWVAGHPHNTTLDADFGDFRSLLIHMKKAADKNDEEFFLFDTGDIIEGTGLSDATDIHGQYVFDIIQNVSAYDALTIGNHDIGHPEVVEFMEKSFIPFWKGSYITSNSMLSSNNDFIGAPFAVIETRLKTRVLVLGYLFNFTHEANNTVVTPVSISLTQPYFKKAMQVPDVDLIVVVAHAAPQLPPELTQIYQAIRSVHSKTPLAILAGHSHVTYFQKEDANAFTIESGKYFEVVGHIQFEIEDGAMQNLATRWVDTSVDNFISLSGVPPALFPTPAGAETKALIQHYQQILGLNIVYGCSPDTFWPEDPFSSNTSLYRLLVEDVVPEIVFDRNSQNTQFYLTNTASLRYALFEGKVTRNDIYTISPFNDTYVHFQSIPGAALLNLMHAITNISGLTGGRCAPKLRAAADPEANWYYTTSPIIKTETYDLVTATYDAETILPIVQRLYPEYAKYAPYPTEYNGTGALQAYIEQFFKCANTAKFL